MWQNISNHLTAISAAFLTGLTIKIMDDILDEDYDYLFHKPNLAQKFGRGIAAYGMLWLVLAAFLDRQLVLSLFCAAYAVGMGFSRDAQYPSRLSGFVEGLLVSGISTHFVGIRMTIVAVCLMTAVQLWDNWVDESRRSILPLLMALSLVAWGFVVDGVTTGRVMFAYALFFTLERRWQLWLQ